MQIIVELLSNDRAFIRYWKTLKASIIANQDGIYTICPSLNQEGRDNLQVFTERYGSSAMQTIVGNLLNGNAVNINEQHRELTPHFEPEKIVKLKTPVPQFINALADVADPEEPFTAADVATSKHRYDFHSAAIQLQNGAAACVIANETEDFQGNPEYRFVPVEEDADMFELCLKCKSRAGWSCPLLDKRMNHRLKTLGRARHEAATMIEWVNQRNSHAATIPLTTTSIPLDAARPEPIITPNTRNTLVRPNQSPAKPSTEKFSTEPVVSAEDVRKCMKPEECGNAEKILQQILTLIASRGLRFTVRTDIIPLLGELGALDEFMRNTLNPENNPIRVVTGFLVGAGRGLQCLRKGGKKAIGKHWVASQQKLNTDYAQEFELTPPEHLNCRGCKWDKKGCIIQKTHYHVNN